MGKVLLLEFFVFVCVSVGCGGYGGLFCWKLVGVVVCVEVLGCGFCWLGCVYGLGWLVVLGLLL